MDIQFQELIAAPSVTVYVEIEGFRAVGELLAAQPYGFLDFGLD